MSGPIPPDKIGCHRTGFAKTCKSLVVSGKCNRWLGIRGVNPNTGQDFDRHDCVDNWGPMLILESSKFQRETGAAVESFRNEMVRLNELQFDAQQEALGRADSTQRLINGDRG